MTSPQESLSSPTPAEAHTAAHGVFGLLAIWISQWRFTILMPLVAGTAAAGLSLLLPVQFAAHSKFVAELRGGQSTLPAGIGALAGQFGIPLGGTESPAEFFAGLVTTRAVLEPILVADYAGVPSRLPVCEGSCTLLDLLQIGGASDMERLERGLRNLSRRVTASVDRVTGLVQLRVELPDPQLAAVAAGRILDRLEALNRNLRHSQARETREFVDARLLEAAHDLDASERVLREFREANRRFDDSPQLVLEFERYQRRVVIALDVVLNLRRRSDELRIEELNDTPVLSVVDPPVAPVRKSRPHRAMLVMVALFSAAIVGTVVGFARRRLVDLRRTSDPELQELRRTLQQVRRDLGLFFRRRGST